MHTPGPWYAEESWVLKDIGDRAYHITKCADWSEETEANAHLIAAAPDLLEALKGVLRVADRATVEFDAARAAIAKAEGK